MQSARQTFELELQNLDQEVVRLGALVQGMLEGTLRAIISRDDDLAHTVIREDDGVDKLNFEIEQHCIRLLALQQPMSKDLRKIITIIKIISDLERIGDYSVDIAITYLRMPKDPYFQPMVDIPRIGRLAQELLHKTLRAYIDRDLELARQACMQDDEIDDLHDLIFEEILQVLQRQPEATPQALRFLLISRYLERIADHCTNIAERIPYMETGQNERNWETDEDPFNI